MTHPSPQNQKIGPYCGLSAILSFYGIEAKPIFRLRIVTGSRIINKKINQLIKRKERKKLKKGV